MKKSLVALATLAAAGGAMAQVTIAGIVDTAYYSYDGKSRDGATRLAGQGVGDGSWAGSRIRFSGEEDLGGGMKAGFWIEQGFSPTHGEGMNFRTGGNQPQSSGLSTTAQNRQSWVSLSGDAGTLRVGRVYGALYDFMAVTPTTTLQGMPSANVHINGEYTGTFNANWATATNYNGWSRTKGINYQSPTFGGAFKYYGTVGGEDNNTESIQATSLVPGLAYQSLDSRVHSHRLSYLKDATRLAIVYQRRDARNGAAVAGNESGGIAGYVPNYYGVASAAVGAAPNNQQTTNDITYLGGYNLGWMDVTGIYGTRSNDATAATGVITTQSSQFSQINLRVPMNRWEFRYTWNKYQADNLVNTTGVRTNTFDYNGQMLGAAYHFSGRTKAYFFTGTDKEEVGLANSGTAPLNAAGQAVTRHALGLFHSF